MAKNPLADGQQPADSRKGWTLQQHCDHANAQLILKDINPDRRRMGLPPVHWVIRNGRVVCELLSSAPENTAISTP